MNKKHTLLYLLIIFWFSLNAQNNETEITNNNNLQVGVLFQKTQKLYWENGFEIDYTNKVLFNKRIHFGFDFVTSRLGSAISSNAIKQESYRFNTSYHFRNTKDFKIVPSLNIGYFYADYEEEIFDVLVNTSLIFSGEIGVSYSLKNKLNVPISLNLSTGMNLISGNGIKSAGTLYPFYYQISMLYSILK
ncbi:MAG: hypothetical protein KAG96_00100 [Ichthyobacteriaceae bacterium]|nr:hypothetical protein [Ichthyobacteriaceae bacterium]